MRPSPTTRAFTLIEVLVVVVILGIASAVIVPQLGTRDDLRAAAAARTLMADLVYAQNRAVALQKTHYILFNTSSGKYDVMDAVSPNHLISQPLLGTPYTVPMNSGAFGGVAFGAISFDNQLGLAFDELGAPYSCSAATGAIAPLVSGSVVLNCNAQKMTVSVLPYSGEIKVQ